MANITIRNLDENLKTRLRLQAASHGCSMEAEARNILQRSLLPQLDDSDFASRIHQRFNDLRLKSLPLPERNEVRTPPDMGE